MAEDSDLEKTESPTQHKIDKAREKGQIARSKELTSVLVLLAGLTVFLFLGENIAAKMFDAFRIALSFDRAIIDDEKRFLQFIFAFVSIVLQALLPIFFVLVVIAIFAPMLLGGLFFNPGSIKFDMARWNPVSGIKRMFSIQVFAELLKGLLKAGLAGGVIYLFLSNYIPHFLTLSNVVPSRAVAEVFRLIIICGFFIVLGLIPMVAFDVVYQLWSHFKKLKMTKQEIKDEHKEQDGDPHVKSRIRQLQRAMAQRRMMADVPTADIILTNPTHYSVALKYDESKMTAPKIVAKGMGKIAHKIRELGEENSIPILESPPLARTLYRYAEIGEYIPVNLYAAVAEVLAWVYQLRHWKKYGGDKPKTPKEISIPDNYVIKNGEIDG